jgi:hypothetical protein
VSEVAGGRSLVVGGLGLELGGQSAGVAGGAAHAPFGALGAAGGTGHCEQALGGALCLGVRQQLVLMVGGELGELVHDGPSFPGGGGLVVAFSLSPAARAVHIRSGAQEQHRIRLGVKAVLAPGTVGGWWWAGEQTTGL